VHGPRDELLARPAFAADEYRRPTGRRAGDLLLHMGQHGAGADKLAFRAELLAELQNFAAGLVEVLGQLLLLGKIADRESDVVGDGQREFQVLRVRQALGIGGIKMNEADDFAVLTDRSADRTGGV